MYSSAFADANALRIIQDISDEVVFKNKEWEGYEEVKKTRLGSRRSGDDVGNAGCPR
jgi:hypothetical protein